MADRPGHGYLRVHAQLCFGDPRAGSAGAGLCHRGSAGIGGAPVMAYGKEPGVKIARSYIGNENAASEIIAQLEGAMALRFVLLSSDLARDSMKGSGRYSALKASLSGLAAKEAFPTGKITEP